MCSILRTAFILLLLIFHIIKGSNDANVTSDNCYWSGVSPICNGKCREEETVAAESHKNDGQGCITGKKLYCCKAEISLNKKEESTATENSSLNNAVRNTTAATLLSNSNNCHWVGTAPNCQSYSCEDGYYEKNASRTAEGSTCITGKKKYCCKGTRPDPGQRKPDFMSSGPTTRKILLRATTARPEQTINGNKSSRCYWSGTPPVCDGSCQIGEYVAGVSVRGAGDKCESGQKKYCCPRRGATPNSATTQPSTEMKTTTARSGNSKTTSATNRSVTSSTSLRNQTWHRPMAAPSFHLKNYTVQSLNQTHRTINITTQPPLRAVSTTNVGSSTSSSTQKTTTVTETSTSTEPSTKTVLTTTAVPLKTTVSSTSTTTTMTTTTTATTLETTSMTSTTARLPTSVSRKVVHRTTAKSNNVHLHRMTSTIVDETSITAATPLPTTSMPLTKSSTLRSNIVQLPAVLPVPLAMRRPTQKTTEAPTTFPSIMWPSPPTRLNARQPDPNTRWSQRLPDDFFLQK